MRIALIPSAYAPFLGGVESTTRDLARELRRGGHEVEVWTARSPGDELLSTETIDGVLIRRFVFHAPRASPRSIALWPVRATRELFRMTAAVRGFRPDVLHVQCFGANGVYATFSSLITRRPLVITLQGETFMDDQEIYGKSLFLRLGLRFGLWRAQAVTGCSDFTLRDAIDRFGLRSSKASVVFNAVDMTSREGSPDDGGGPRYVLGLGRLVRRKGFDLLLRAWAEIQHDYPDVHLVLAGSGPDELPLRSDAERLSSVGRVTFVGAVDQGEASQLMQRAEVFVMPSRIEAFGIVALEAWRAGTPAIVSAHGGPREFVEHGVSGLVVSPEQPGVLAASIRQVLDDPALREALTSNGRRQLPAFSWTSIGERYEQIYRSLEISGRGPD